MNYLAHVYLSCDSEKLLVGNLIADFLQNKDLIGIDDELMKGIELHRSIDSFTDDHEMFKKSTKRLYKRHGKYAPVLTDILYDYLLIENWKLFSGETLEQFTSQVYEILINNLDIIPDKIKDRINRMVDDNFLMVLSSKEGLQRSLNYMDRRTNFPSRFSEAVIDLETSHDKLTLEFRSFFPQLINHVENNCKCD